MYQITKKIENIDSFKVFDKYLGFKFRENKRHLYLNENIVDEDNRGYLFFQNSLCLHNGGKTTFLNLYSKEKTEIPITFNGDIGYFQNTYISSINSKQEEDYRWTSNYVIYQLFPFKELYRLPHRYYGSGYRFENQYIQIQSEKNILKSLSLLTGEYEWEVDLGKRKYMDLGQEKEAHIRNIVGVWENILVVTMTHNEVITIDLKTGTILWETQDLLKKHLHKGNAGKWRGYLQNCYIENGKLYELTSSIYYSIDLQTQRVEILWQDTREHEFVTVVHSTYTENYVYFTGSYNNRFQPHLLGVFNRQTRQIDWLHDMTLSVDPNLGYVASLNQVPQVTDDKLYILDSGGTLHIFEKEQA